MGIETDPQAVVDPVAWERAVEAANRSMTPDEQSWASLKCGGGPHTENRSAASRQSSPEHDSQTHDRVPYAGGCEVLGREIVIVPIAEMNPDRANLPA